MRALKRPCHFRGPSGAGTLTENLDPVPLNFIVAPAVWLEIHLGCVSSARMSDSSAVHEEAARAHGSRGTT